MAIFQKSVVEKFLSELEESVIDSAYSRFKEEYNASRINEIKTISIQNSLLTENFDSQANIVVISANGVRNTLNLDKRIPEGEIIYN